MGHFRSNIKGRSTSGPDIKLTYSSNPTSLPFHLLLWDLVRRGKIIMVSCRFLCLAVAVCLIGAAVFPPEVLAGGGLRAKKLLAAYLIAKAVKPRFVPIPLPLPFPIKLGKDSYVKHPVHTYSHSAHAQLVHDPWQGAGGYGGGHGGEGWY